MSENVRGTMTPREVVGELDRYIVGQDHAKKMVAIALRNRWRRRQVPEELRDEIAPKNIIMIGPTGVGKTEIARRLARLAQAPFLKVEASKFTEVGYVGRDVESMIRDLTEIGINLVKEEEREKVMVKAEDAVEERLLDLLLPDLPTGFEHVQDKAEGGTSHTRQKMRELLRSGKLDERRVDVEVPERNRPVVEVFSAQGMEELDINLRDMFGNMLGGRRTRQRKMTIKEARDFMKQEESQKLIDMDMVVREGIRRVEESGIVFLDEIDKVAGREASGRGPDVSREGVQRDLLPIIEGSTVTTKHGPVRTDHILFVAAGAFHMSKVSDLIPELQGRFPIRVELDSLKRDDFVKILKEPQNSLVRKYKALLETEGIEIVFTDGAIEAIAEVADHVNDRSENIGARRLHTVMERLLEDISFRAPELTDRQVKIDRTFVEEQLSDVGQAEDLGKYIL